jgi:hypothetical protein
MRVLAKPSMVTALACTSTAAVSAIEIVRNMSAELFVAPPATPRILFGPVIRLTIPRNVRFAVFFSSKLHERGRSKEALLALATHDAALVALTVSVRSLVDV